MSYPVGMHVLSTDSDFHRLGSDGPVHRYRLPSGRSVVTVVLAGSPWLAIVREVSRWRGVFVEDALAARRLKLRHMPQGAVIVEDTSSMGAPAPPSDLGAQPADPDEGERDAFVDATRRGAGAPTSGGSE